MKPKRLLISCAFFLAWTGISSAQQTEQDIQATLPEDLGRTYGYVAGQRLKVEKIAARFPQLASEANKAQMQWDSVFASAAENLEPQLQKLFKGQWPEVQEKMESQIESMMSAPLSSEQAREFIQEVESRAKGNMRPPTLETLLAYHPTFRQKPAAEFLQGFKTVFESDGVVKSALTKYFLIRP